MSLKKLYGNDVVVYAVLEKIELAARRAWTSESSQHLPNFADEIHKMLKEMMSDA